MPIPDEKARAWTRPQDYWPPRRPARGTSGSERRRTPANDLGDPLASARPPLGAVPFFLLMLALAVLAAAILIAAWPGRHFAQATPSATAADPGTAPRIRTDPS